MRIAIITDFLAGLGGTEALTTRMALGLHDRGHDVRVFCPRSPSQRTWIELLRSSKVPVLLGAPNRFFPDDRGAHDRAPKEQLLDRAAVRLLKLAFRRWRPDVILANPMGPLLVTWLRSGAMPTIPVVGYEFSAADSRCAHWYPPDLSGVINGLDTVIAGCEASRKGVAAYHGFVGRIEIVPPLVPTATSLPLPAELWKLGCVARLCVEKGLDYLLAALPEIRAAEPRATLHIYGDGYDRIRLGDLARALKIDDMVTLAGPYDPRTGIDNVAARHAVFIQPSLFESIPTSLLEIAARGRVVVASAVGGIPEFFAAGGQGALVRPAFPSDIAQAVSDLLAHPEKLADAGMENALVISKHYAYQQSLQDLESFLDAAARRGEVHRIKPMADVGAEERSIAP